MNSQILETESGSVAEDTTQRKKEPKQTVESLSKIVEMENLIIPPYQRPYKWGADKVVQLLDDIFEHTVTKEKVYRIGSLIIHEDEDGKKNIVDGQQRLTTISILLHKLAASRRMLTGQTYRNAVSKDTIARNAGVIDNWLIRISNKNLFTKALLERCEFVEFTVFEQEEAFQLFDSQNARGKGLEPYDLLKAFHLREMEFDTEAEREQAVLRWEKSVDDNTLKPILGNHLFKIRKWCRNESKYDFTKDDIDEFKGISLHRKQQYPFENALRMLDGFVANAQNDKFLKNLEVAQSYPFSITMPIINGKRFFEYVDYYIQQKDVLLSEEDEFNAFYHKYCLDYARSGRSGDEKVRNLYENILLLFSDKFGITSDFKDYYEAFYKAVYSIRCNNKSVRQQTILNSSAKGILQEVNNAIVPEKLKKYQYANYKIEETKKPVEGIEIIKNFITDGK